MTASPMVWLDFLPFGGEFLVGMHKSEELTFGVAIQPIADGNAGSRGKVADTISVENIMPAPDLQGRSETRRRRVLIRRNKAHYCTKFSACRMQIVESLS